MGFSLIPFVFSACAPLSSGKDIIFFRKRRREGWMRWGGMGRGREVSHRRERRTTHARVRASYAVGKVRRQPTLSVRWLLFK